MDVLCEKSSEDAVAGLSTDSDDDTDPNDSDNNSDSNNWEIDNKITIMDKNPIPFELCGTYKTPLLKVRSIVKLFKTSSLKNNILQNYINEEFGEGKKLTLLLDCRIRWNSIQIMLERFLNLKKCIKKSLVDL